MAALKIPEVTVLTHIGGSTVVVELGSRGHYIDARSDVRYPGVSFIDVVRGGQVRQNEAAPDDRAPQVIMALARKALGIHGISGLPRIRAP